MKFLAILILIYMIQHGSELFESIIKLYQIIPRFYFATHEHYSGCLYGIPATSRTNFGTK